MRSLIPKGFIPTDDSGQLFGLTEAAQDTSFAAMRDKQQQLVATILKNPHVDGVISAMGLGGSSQVLNQGRIVARLTPPGTRPDAEHVLAELRPELLKVPGIRLYLQSPPTIRLGTYISKSLYVYTLQDADTGVLYSWAPRLEAALRKLPELQDVTSDLQLNSQRVALTIDRARAAALGVSASQIENALYSAYGQRQVGTFYTPTNQYWIVMELEPEFRDSPAALGSLYVRSNAGNLVPLSELTIDSRGVSPLFVSHTGQVPAVTISFNLAPGVALSQAITRIEAEKQRLGLPLSMTGSFQGTAQAFQDSVTGLGLLLAFAVFVIYVVLGILYESYIHPLTILSGLPAAGLGALLTLLVFGRELDLYAFVGVIMLIGIVKKNAIMMIDFALEAERKHGKPPREAIPSNFGLGVLSLLPRLSRVCRAQVHFSSGQLGLGSQLQILCGAHGDHGLHRFAICLSGSAARLIGFSRCLVCLGDPRVRDVVGDRFRLEQKRMVDVNGRCIGRRHDDPQAELRHVEQTCCEVEGHPDAAMRCGVARQRATVQGDAGPR